MAALVDNFTGSAAELSTHTSDSSHTWSNLSPATFAINLTGSGTVYSVSTAGNFNVYVSSYTPPSADYTVKLTLDPKSDLNNASGVMGRESGASISALNGYLGRYDQTDNEFQLFKCVAGSFTALGTDYAASLSAGDTLELVMQGDQISVKVNGTTRIGPVTDTSITSAGTAALWMSNAVGTTTTGLHFDKVETIEGAPATAYTMTGPTAGPNGAASSNFTLTPNGLTSVTITPADGGAGGTFTPTSLTWTGDAVAKTFTYTAASTGNKTISVTDSGSLTDPANITYNSKATASRTYSITDGSPSTTTYYTITNNDSTLFGARTSTGVIEIGSSGIYKIIGAVVPADLAGEIVWDQGGTLIGSEDLAGSGGGGGGARTIEI